MIRTTIFSLLVLLTISTSAQNNYKYEIIEKWENDQTTYSIVNNNGDTIKKLDPEKYVVSLQPFFNDFAIFIIKGRKVWSAIDLEENYLFQVYNRYSGEPFPDYLIENRIRIVGNNGLIGFADSKGKIVIEPQFESVSEFNNDFAIFKLDCKEIHKNQDGEHSGFLLLCEKTGYIDKSGDIKTIEKISFDEMKMRINWNGKQ